MHVRPRLLVTAVLLVPLLPATGCTDLRPGPSSLSAPASPAAPVSPAPSGASTAATPAATPTAASPSAPAPVTAAPVTTAATNPAAAPPLRSSPAPATRLSLSVSTRGGALRLVRGGPAQEFTLTLRNGNTRAYRHLLLTFQTESFGPAPGDLPGPAASLVLERRDPATGRWNPVELRIANDFKPYALHVGGSPLDRDAVRTERYRLRATATGPTGSSPLEVRALDTDAPEGAGEELERPARLTLPHTTRRAS
ncbi:hypothetical protein ABZZ17_04485 [Streptomyces sp. NPDC006512]|uniref:hypothetical protein n=1 Tax=Streptomyces sp. NPDC006512 TaxID=3154307 RepID=UPI0033A19864